MRLLSLSAILALISLYHSAFATQPVRRNYNTHNYYVLEHLPNHPYGASLADIADALGVEIVEQAGQLLDHWLVRAKKSESTLHAREEVEPDTVLRTIEHLNQLSQSKQRRSEDTLHARKITSSLRYFSKQQPRQRVKRAPPPISNDESDVPASRIVADRFGIHDPLFSDQWHLVNEVFTEHSMNVTPVWELGITGKGIITAMVDDGVDYDSEDLKDNFDAVNSWDYNDHEPLPTPKLFDDHHGTRCAGQIAAGKNNACGLGIAYDAKISGIRILSGPISDVDEAAALNHGFQNISIYSCSWGPPDNGKSMEGPSYLIQKAVVNGINRGRDGKGSIFVFASGNGAGYGDQCNYDGYTNSIYSVTVSAVDYKGLHPYYSEPCAANMIVAYSSGSGKHIVTTDKGKNECTQSHGGTSAAAPNAAGVFTLALQARPDLTWRDVQHLCVETARLVNPDDPDWEKTATGRLYSYKYGYGALDASRFINAAKDWKLVKPQAWFESPAIILNGGFMNSSQIMLGGKPIPTSGLTSTFTVTKEILQENNFEKLEHVRVRVWIDHSRRGDVEVSITSPSGVRSVLGVKREHDADKSGYPGWMFMSVKHWGEDPVGDWTIHVSDQANESHTGRFLGWNMMLWGSAIDAARAVQYELPLLDDVFPPQEGPHDTTGPISIPASTKTHPKPTLALEPGHGEVEGENTSPAFPQVTAPAEPSSPASTPTPDEGWFPGMSTLVSNQKWVFGASGAVLLFAAGTGFFFWKRRLQRKRRENYSTVPDDEVALGAMRESGHGLRQGEPRTKELYDAFGEVSDDEDADEETRLRGSLPGDSLRDHLGYHSGFLDDEDPESGPRYRDEPNPVSGSSHSSSDLHTPDGPQSSDGSWEQPSIR